MVLWLLKCCFLWPQQTMAAPIHKYPLCDFSNVVSCGHNKLWLPPSTNTLSVTSQMFFPVATTNYGCPHLQIPSVTSQMLFPVATTNYGCPHPQIPSMWLLKCSFMWPQQTMAAPSTNTLYGTSQMLFPVATRNYGCPIYKYPLCEFWIISESLSRIKQAKNAFKMSISRQLMSVHSNMIK